MDVFIMLGQSNMAGRGYKKDVEPILNPKCFQLRNGRWQQMRTPVNPDRTISGVSLAESFADEYSRYYDTEVGLVPCADGGTTLEDWKIDGGLFLNAVYQTLLAKRIGEVKGILWHQGESDCLDKRYLSYKENCLAILDEFSKRTELNNVPVIMGELGTFLKYNEEKQHKNYPKINAILKEIAKERKNIFLASARGLTSNPDMIHFDAKSERVFGVRYFKVYKSNVKR